MPITDPTDITGCTLWLEADAIAGADGSNPTAWPDQSGNGNTFVHPPDDTLVSGTSPTQEGTKPLVLRTSFLNGHKVLEWVRTYGLSGTGPGSGGAYDPGGASMMTCTVDPDAVFGVNGHTFFAVARLRNIWSYDDAHEPASALCDLMADADGQSLWGLSDYITPVQTPPDDEMIYAFASISTSNTPDGSTFDDAPFTARGVPIATDDWFVYHMRHDLTAHRMATHDPVGCAASTSASPYLYTGNWHLAYQSGLLLGGGGSVFNCWDGYIAEVVVYNRALTNGEQNDVLNYLGTKYALTVTPSEDLCPPVHPEVASPAPMAGVL